jgi:phage portal protein BeeE
MALFFRGSGAVEQRATNLPQLIDEATGGRRGVGNRPVGWSNALAIPAVWAAVRLRANVVASLPASIYRDRGGLPERVGPLPSPSADLDLDGWLHAGQVALDLRGNNYGRILARDPRTYLPTQIELVHPDRRAGTRRPRRVRRIQIRREKSRRARRVARAAERGTRVGHGPVADHRRRDRARRHLAAEEYGAGFFGEALTPSALLASDAPIDEDGAKIVKRRVRRNAAGPRAARARRQLELQDAVDQPDRRAAARGAQIRRRATSRAVRRAGRDDRAPPSGSSVTYANREQRTQDLLAFRLGPAIARRERALSRLTVRGQYVKLNTAALLRTDLLTRLKAYEIGHAARRVRAWTRCGRSRTCRR